MARRRTIGEFDVIARLFAPLARGEPGAYGLTDDAAVLAMPAGRALVVTTDTVVAGVHFLADDPPEDVAWKALAVNLSDLAAMGAAARAYTLAAAFAGDLGWNWMRRFARGLARAQAAHRVALIGGDTVATPGPSTFTITALGAVAGGRALRRSGARPGDAVYVSGTIGDGALGLLARQGKLERLPARHRRALIRRYRRPLPRLALGARLIDAASAAIDVSDGLVADLGHVCETSGVGAVVEVARVPLSPAAAAAVRADNALAATALAGGDDYELAFTAPPSRAAGIARIARALRLPLTMIGRIEAVTGAADGPVRLLGPDGRTIRAPGIGGYRHAWRA
jgi:thiamine-monophosphate kinase